MAVLAIIPARKGSKGITNKNFRTFGGLPLYAHAAVCAGTAGIVPIVISSDAPDPGLGVGDWLQRPASLAQDDTPMFDVVKHAADTLMLADDDIIVLLQPTQPFRTPEHIQQAIALLRETQADSVVSVVELPKTHHPRFACEVGVKGRLVRWGCLPWSWDELPARRQDVDPAFIRDGTVYAFPVKTLTSGTIYGHDVRPLLIPPEESCELDSESDWADVERRWRERA